MSTENEMCDQSSKILESTDERLGNNWDPCRGHRKRRWIGRKILRTELEIKIKLKSLRKLKMKKHVFKKIKNPSYKINKLDFDKLT